MHRGYNRWWWCCWWLISCAHTANATPINPLRRLRQLMTKALSFFNGGEERCTWTNYYFYVQRRSLGGGEWKMNGNISSSNSSDLSQSLSQCRLTISGLRLLLHLQLQFNSSRKASLLSGLTEEGEAICWVHFWTSSLSIVTIKFGI